MSESSLLDYAQRELKYQARKTIAQGIRENCPEGDPMTTNITVMLSTIINEKCFGRRLNAAKSPPLRRVRYLT